MLFVPPSIPFMVPEAEAWGDLDFDIFPKNWGNTEPWEKHNNQPIYYAGESLTIQGHWDNSGVGEFPIYVASRNTSGCNSYVEACGTESTSTAWNTTTQADGNGDFSITLDVSQIAEDGFGSYSIRVEASESAYHGLSFWFESGTRAAAAQAAADAAGAEAAEAAAADADTTPPVLALVCCWHPIYDDPSDNITRTATNSTGYNVNFNVTANDDIDGYVGNAPSGIVSCSSDSSDLVPAHFPHWQAPLFPVGVGVGVGAGVGVLIPDIFAVAVRVRCSPLR